MKKLSLLLLLLLFVRCGGDPSHCISCSVQELNDITDKLNAMVRENKNLQDDITKNQNAIQELMDLSVTAKDDLAKTILMERISELMKVRDVKAQKIRDNNNAMLEYRVKVDRLIVSIKHERNNKSDTTRNILSIDSVQQVN